MGELGGQDKAIGDLGAWGQARVVPRHKTICDQAEVCHLPIKSTLIDEESVRSVTIGVVVVRERLVLTREKVGPKLSDAQRFRCRTSLSRDMEMGNSVLTSGDRLKLGCGDSVLNNGVYGQTRAKFGDVDQALMRLNISWSLGSDLEYDVVLPLIRVRCPRSGNSGSNSSKVSPTPMKVN